MEFPYCTHKQLVSCQAAIALKTRLAEITAGDADFQSSDPVFECSQPCSLHQGQQPPLPCGHACTNKCGRCTEATLQNIASVPSLPMKVPLEKTLHIGECSLPCQRQLVCGHACGEKVCHGSSECPPCKKKCAIKCPHTEYVTQKNHISG